MAKLKDRSEDQLVVERVPIRSITYYPDNPRKGDLEILVESLEAHGQTRPLVVQKSSRHVLIGNHTLKAARRLKWKEIDVVIRDVDDEEAKRIVLVDNRTSDLGGYDNDALTELLGRIQQSSDQLVGTGYTDLDLGRLTGDVSTTPAAPIEKRCPSCRHEWTEPAA